MIIRFIVLTLLPTLTFGQSLSRPAADAFLRTLFADEDSLAQFADYSTLSLSHRLGINYEAAPNKFLISYDFDANTKAQVRQGQIHYTSSLIDFGQGYQRLTVSVGQPSAVKEFYFHNGRLTSPLFYYAARWKIVDSKFFRFVISDSTLTNSYAIKALDNFVITMDSILGFSNSDLHLLQERKILYYLCRDEDEIEKLTGFRTRGMYNLAFDAIISTYNAHFHELAHLLINFKIRNAKLFCHPLLQEGFAVAVGGRGGIKADVVLHLGSYLDESRAISYSDLLEKDAFMTFDPSLSYPAAGLYNLFLLDTLGIDGYLALYRRHCGSLEEGTVRSISESELPSPGQWATFLKKFRRIESVKLTAPSKVDQMVLHSDSISLYRGTGEYFFQLKSAYFFGQGSVEPSYRSKRFAELFPYISYQGYRYVLLADSQSVSVYNLLTNDLIASYVASFEISPAAVPSNHGMYYFSVPVAAFDQPLESLMNNGTTQHQEIILK